MISSTDFDCIVSIVVYNTDVSILKKAVESLFDTKLKIKLFLIDTGNIKNRYNLFPNQTVEYHFMEMNLGYGAGNNFALSLSEECKYFLIMNPDVFIIEDALEKLIQFMDRNSDIGILIPKVLNEDGSIQYLNKRHPAILPLFIRRFLPKSLQKFFQNTLDLYEMKDLNYDENFSVPFISGAFMLCQKNILDQVGGFDKRFFLYFEDADLSRKIQSIGFKTVYYSKSKIIHIWNRGSHKESKLAFYFISSMIKYFQKWGWSFFLSE